MPTISNVIAGELTIKIQRHAAWPPFGFELYQTEDTVIDLTTLDDVRMGVVNVAGVELLNLRIGQGFEIINNEVTGNPTILRMDVAYISDQLGAGWYRYDMLVVAGGIIAGFPLNGFLIVEQNITQ